MLQVTASAGYRSRTCCFVMPTGCCSTPVCPCRRAAQQEIKQVKAPEAKPEPPKPDVHK